MHKPNALHEINENGLLLEDYQLLICSNEYPPRGGGAGVLAFRLSEELGNTPVTPPLSNHLRSAGYVRTARLTWLPELAWNLFNKIWVTRPRTIVLNDLGALLAWGMIRYIVPQASAVYIHHGLLSQGSLRFFTLKKRIAERTLRSGVVRSVFVSEYIRKEIAKEVFSGVLPKRTVVLHVPPPFFSKPPTSNPVRQLSEKGVIKFGVFGRVNDRKIPIRAVQFLAEFAKHIEHPVTLLIYGAGDEYYKAQLKREAAKFQLQDFGINIDFAGLVSANEVINAMSKCHAIANFSCLKEACPTVSLEASAAGVPYIFTGENGNNELQAYASQASIQICLEDPQSPAGAAKQLKNWSHSRMSVYSKPLPTISAYLSYLKNCDKAN